MKALAAHIRSSIMKVKSVYVFEGKFKAPGKFVNCEHSPTEHSREAWGMVTQESHVRVEGAELCKSQGGEFCCPEWNFPGVEPKPMGACVIVLSRLSSG